MTATSIARQIKTARKNRGVSQRKLATEAGTTQAVISRIENHTVNPSVDLVSRISTVLNTNFQVAAQSFKKQLVGEYQNLNLIDVSHAALKNNFNYYQSLHPESVIAPVLKSNAYGHGLTLIAHFVDQKLQVPFICVDSLYEAYELEKAAIKTPVLIMGYTLPQNFTIKKNLSHFHFSVFDLDTAQILNRYQPGVKIHLKIDTGMNRLGIKPSNIPRYIKELKKLNNLKVEGIFSHLSQADDTTIKSYTNKQIYTFKQSIALFEQAGFHFHWKHLFATSAASYLTDPDFNLIRLGLGFYGLSPLTRGSVHQSLTDKLKPALSLATHLAQVKQIEKGSQISYGGTYRTKKPITIGILPLGYYDGIDHRLSNRGFVKLKKTFCSILGNVCMNLTIIDITKVPNARVGDRVEIISNRARSPNSINSIAQEINTIPYELLVKLAESTKRIITK
jgi:alanine racemase